MSSRPGRELFHRVGGTRRWVAIDATLGIITIGSAIGLTTMATSLLTRAALLGSTVSLSLMILGVRFFALTRVVGRYCERYLGHLGTFRVLTRLRVWLFARLLDADPRIVLDRRRGDVVTGLVDDIETMQDRLLRVSSPPLIAAGTLVIGCGVLVVIDVRTAVVLAGSFLVMALTLPALIHARTRTTAAQVIGIRAERLTEATELLDARETLEVWGRTDRLATTLGRFDVLEADVNRRLTRIRALLDGLVVLLTGSCVAAAVIVIDTPGPHDSGIWWLAAAPLITLASFEALAPLLMTPEHRARTDRAAARVLLIADDAAPAVGEAIDSDPLRSPVDPHLELRHVGFAFPDTDPVLVDASLSIPFGSTIAITAPSGTGKSTLVQLLLGLLQPDAGSISIGTIDASELRRCDRPVVAAVMQHDHVFDTTVRDNLLVGDGDASDIRLLEACEISGLTAFLEEREGGLDARIGPNGAALSGGERQRLMIARALVADAPILLLDEATENLEPELRATVVDAILDARRGRTTVLLGHDLDGITRCDATYDLVDGMVRTRRPSR